MSVCTRTLKEHDLRLKQPKLLPFIVRIRALHTRAMGPGESFRRRMSGLTRRVVRAFLGFGRRKRVAFVFAFLEEAHGIQARSMGGPRKGEMFSSQFEI